MNMYELAGMLDGSTYGNEVNKETAELAKENGLVIVYGASDDLMEFRGTIDDEADVYNGGTIYLDENGLFRTPDCSGDEDRCPYLIAARDRCKTIAALWNKRGSNWAWEYETDIPHADFRVFDGDDNSPYCLGIVFSVQDLKSVEVVPVMHGRWVADSDGLPVCSVCDEVAMQRLHCDTLHGAWRYDVRLVKTPYCPNCGAKMDGERRDSE